jgi:hypothetical protein
LLQAVQESLMLKCNNVRDFVRDACFLEFCPRNMSPTCRKRGVDEGHMDDDLMGRLVANAGVDSMAAGVAGTSGMHFLLTRERAGR